MPDQKREVIDHLQNAIGYIEEHHLGERTYYPPQEVIAHNAAKPAGDPEFSPKLR